MPQENKVIPQQPQEEKFGYQIVFTPAAAQQTVVVQPASNEPTPAAPAAPEISE